MQKTVNLTSSHIQMSSQSSCWLQHRVYLQAQTFGRIAPGSLDFPGYCSLQPTMLGVGFPGMFTCDNDPQIPPSAQSPGSESTSDLSSVLSLQKPYLAWVCFLVILFWAQEFFSSSSLSFACKEKNMKFCGEKGIRYLEKPKIKYMDVGRC